MKKDRWNFEGECHVSVHKWSRKKQEKEDNLAKDNILPDTTLHNTDLIYQSDISDNKKIFLNHDWETELFLLKAVGIL